MMMMMRICWMFDLSFAAAVRRDDSVMTKNVEYGGENESETTYGQGTSLSLGRLG